MQTSQTTTGGGDWNDAPDQSSDWATQVDQTCWNETAPPADEWADNSNDGNLDYKFNLLSKLVKNHETFTIVMTLISPSLYIPLSCRQQLCLSMGWI